jgi:cardiolipin synthase (CMP-forming)
MSRDRRVSTSAILTLPNALSFARIASIPLIAWAIVHRGTEAAGLVAFGVIASTDWIDGYIARRTHQVTEVGKILDPLADRLAIVAVLAALVVRGLFPVWAAALIVVRDVALLLVGAIALWRRGIRIDVRRIGKAATLALMIAIPAIAWGQLDLWAGVAASIVGWLAFAAGIVMSYAAAGLYVGDLRRGLARRRSQA